MRNYKGGFWTFLLRINDKLLNNENAPYLVWIVRHCTRVWDHHSVHSTYGQFIYVVDVGMKELEAY